MNDPEYMRVGRLGQEPGVPIARQISYLSSSMKHASGISSPASVQIRPFN